MSFMFQGEALAPVRRVEDEIIIDDFCGGGGASTAIFMALGRHPDEAANHNAAALAMHLRNHPTTHHWNQNVWKIDPTDLCKGRPIGLAWFSPDCKHFSKAAAGQPRDKNIRNLAWVVHLYARLPRHLRPRVIILENVEEFQTWGELLPNGKPDPGRKGKTFHLWVAELRRLGYDVEWREVRACDFGAPTLRKRLFLMARCDGVPISWPEPTHGEPLSVEVRSGKKRPYRTIAEVIDWLLPCPSIFSRSKPLAENTLRRVAKGFRRFVLEAAAPFIVTCNHAGDGFRGQAVTEPFKTITAARDAHGLVTPYVSRFHGKGTLGSRADTPAPTFEARNKTAVVAPFLAKHYGGVVGHSVNRPLGTITAVDHHSVVAAYLTSFYSDCTNGGDGRLDRPIGTVTAGGFHHGVVEADLAAARMTEEERYGAWWVARFAETYGDMESQSIIPGPRPAYLTVHGIPIVDLGLRMLQPRELFNAQGFPSDYIIDFEYNGRPLTKEAQQRMCGNSVSPPPAAALIAANCSDLAVAGWRLAA